MIYPANLHTHTMFCDGADTPAELAARAERYGFVALGFSGHAPMPFAQDWCMTRAGNQAYLSQLHALREEYDGRLDILIGIEQDMFSIPPLAEYDFTIGSAHYLCLGETYICIDDTLQQNLDAAARWFDGDYYALAAAYYAQLTQVVEKTEADIIGHFDLIAKFNEGNAIFDEQDDRYRQPALAALRALATFGKPLEINTGAMYRGWRSVPYPALFLLREWRSLGGEIVLSSDSHHADSLGFMFDEAAALARQAGFSYALLLRRDGWTRQSLI